MFVCVEQRTEFNAFCLDEWMEQYFKISVPLGTRGAQLQLHLYSVLFYIVRHVSTLTKMPSSGTIKILVARALFRVVC